MTDHDDNMLQACSTFGLKQAEEAARSVLSADISCDIIRGMAKAQKTDSCHFNDERVSEFDSISANTLDKIARYNQGEPCEEAQMHDLPSYTNKSRTR